MKKFETPQEALESLKKTPKKTIAKAVTKFIVKRSVSGAIVTLVHNYVPTETTVQKAELYIAAWAMGGVVGDSAGDWASEKVGDVIEIFEDINWNPETTKATNDTTSSE